MKMSISIFFMLLAVTTKFRDSPIKEINEFV